MALDLEFEKLLWSQGYQRIVGIDEVGRGALAGPVTVGGVLLQAKLKVIPSELKSVKDSKQLTARQRDSLYKPLTHEENLSWAVASSSAKVVDEVGIVRAIERAMVKVVKKLAPVDFLILDGRLSFPLPIKQSSLEKADQKIFSVAAASIIAKVHRDQWMVRYHKLYPQYNFRQHKGYGTKEHREALTNFGFSPLHRKTFHSSCQNV
jgi:ribonuclease HII